jgi:large subunit ribosomal protein L3
MKIILGKKIDMTQVWRGEDAVAVTRVLAGPCFVSQIKTKKNDGYDAIQITFEEKKKKNMAKPQAGHLKKAGLEIDARFLREFRLDKNGRTVEKDIKQGDMIGVDTFEAGDIVKVTGTSKGKGFQGVVKKYGFSGSKKTHGNKDQLRMPGSSGATGPAHVFKGSRMPGRMGDDKVTVSNMEIIEVDKENNILLVKGAVPGARNGLVLIAGEGELKVTSKQEPAKEAEKIQEVKAETAKEENIEVVVEEAHEKIEEKKKVEE